MKILMIMTSHGRLGSTGERTGFWLEEFAAPYYVFKKAGAEVTLASPLGGQPPIDPRSNNYAAQTEATDRFQTDSAAQSALARTQMLSSISETDFDAVFYVGGHGLLWDLVDNPDSIFMIEKAILAGKPIATVSHAAGVLRHAKTAYGRPIVQGHHVTGFANTEEQVIGLICVVPFLIEDMLTSGGGIYSKAGDWQPHVVSDGLLITGQNSASSQQTARALVQRLFVRAPAQSAEMVAVPW